MVGFYVILALKRLDHVLEKKNLHIISSRSLTVSHWLPSPGRLVDSGLSFLRFAVVSDHSERGYLRTADGLSRRMPRSLCTPQPIRDRGRRFLMHQSKVTILCLYVAYETCLTSTEPSSSIMMQRPYLVDCQTARLLMMVSVVFETCH